jgi:hypothetical protein
MSCESLTKNGQQCSREGKYLGCCLQHAQLKMVKSTEGLKLLKVEKATDDKHKFVAVFSKDGKTKKVPFGAKGYDDYTLSKNKIQRENYKNRHSKDLYTKDPLRAGYLSYYILWGDSTDINKNVKEYKRMFNL